MTILGALGVILHNIIFVYTWIVIIASLLSFVNPDPYNPIVQTLYRLTNPLYRWIRRYVPTVFGGVDLAPLYVILALYFIDLAFIVPLANHYKY